MVWGFGPFDNNDAINWKLELKNIYDVIDVALETGNHNEARAAATLILRLGQDLYDMRLFDKHVEMAIGRLESVLNDGSWVGSWEDGGTRLQAILTVREEIVELTKMTRPIEDRWVVEEKRA